MIIGKDGLQHMAGFLYHLNRFSGKDVVKIMDHEFLPKTWVVWVEGGRAFQLALKHDDQALEIDYLQDGVGQRVIGVYDEEALAIRALEWLLGNTDEV